MNSILAVTLNKTDGFSQNWLRIIVDLNSKKIRGLALDRQEFNELLRSELKQLMDSARKADELSYLFSILGINSGAEDAGWQPALETRKLFHDLVGLINAPMSGHARVRIGLLLYCHLTEASEFYHLLYNLLLTVKREPPKVFSFLDQYRGSIPPSAPTKVKKIKELSNAQGFEKIPLILDALIQQDIRNAFFHSDYVIFGDELRLKHKGSEIKKIPLADVILLIEIACDYFNYLTECTFEARRSFPAGYKIENRRRADGTPLCSIDVIVDENGIATGFGGADPLPLW